MSMQNHFRIPLVTLIADSLLSQELTDCINTKTKPLGSLGYLEELALQIGLIQATTRPRLVQPTVLVFAGDHGITSEGVSAFPQDVTWQMVQNFLQQGAAINVFAKQNGLQLLVIDAGVNHEFAPSPTLLNQKIAFGTKNFAHQPAMSDARCLQALEAGIALPRRLVGNVVGFGEMGIGNTTSAAALVHCITGLSLDVCVGAGTGLDAKGIAHKKNVIERACRLHADRLGASADPLGVLAIFGGFEIAMMVGAMLAAAAQRMVLLIDGYIVTCALMVAAKLQPAILDYCVFTHTSNENGHRALLQNLNARPLLQLDLRLGEGTGAALAYPLVQAAVNFLVQMASFDSAHVSGKIE